MDAISKLEELSKLNNIKLISLGSKGALSKAWYCINDDIVLVKGNSLYSYEPFSEAYASILADLLGFEHISYWLDSSLGYFDVVTYSDIGYVSLCKYYALDKGLFRLSFFDYVCEKCKGTAIKPKMLTLDEIFEYLLMLPMNIQQKIFEILHFDSIICNVDRHMRNIELVSNKHGVIVDVIPIFDCGASLLYTNSNDWDYDSCSAFKITHKEQVRQIYEHRYVNKAKISSNTVSEFKDKAYNIFKCDSRPCIEDKILSFIEKRIKLYV